MKCKFLCHIFLIQVKNRTETKLAKSKVASRGSAGQAKKSISSGEASKDVARTPLKREVDVSLRSRSEKKISVPAAPSTMLPVHETPQHEVVLSINNTILMY